MFSNVAVDAKSINSCPRSSVLPHTFTDGVVDWKFRRLPGGGSWIHTQEDGRNQKRSRKRGRSRGKRTGRRGGKEGECENDPREGRSEAGSGVDEVVGGSVERRCWYEPRRRRGTARHWERKQRLQRCPSRSKDYRHFFWSTPPLWRRRVARKLLLSVPPMMATAKPTTSSSHVRTLIFLCRLLLAVYV
ncbi:unnamed protein product [Ectocarpus sp. 12 AP-2014]